MNQCDGCRIKAPLNKVGNHHILTGFTGCYKGEMQVCTKSDYCMLKICNLNHRCQQPKQCGPDGFNAVKRNEEYVPLYNNGEGHHETDI